MLISVVIPTKDRPDALRDALRSIVDGAHEDFEIIVIDQSAGDESRTVVAELADDRVTHVFNRRQGFGAASSRNLGMAMAASDVIAITDDDVVAPSDWLRKITERFVADPDLDFICGGLIAPEYDRTAGHVPEYRPDPSLARRKLAQQVSGASFSLRRRVLHTVGGYDEFCGPGSRLRASDDTDFCHRVLRAGCRVAVEPDIWVLHANGFRAQGDASALFERYAFGNGGNYGRFVRSGDLLALRHFASSELRLVARVLLGRSSVPREELRLQRVRLSGFVAGFRLPRHSGHVEPEDFGRLEHLARGIRNASRA